MVSLVEVAVKRRSVIRRLADTFYNALVKSASVEAGKAIRSPPPPISTSRGVPHLVEDGGSAIEVLEAYAVYAVRAWAAVYDAASGSYPEASSASDATVGLVVPYTAHEKRVRVYRETVEAYAALNALRRASGVRGGVILWDGSLSTIIASDRPGASELPLQKAEEALMKTLGFKNRGELQEALEEPVARRASSPGGPLAYEEVVERIAAAKGGLGAEDWPLIAFVEWHEKALAYRMLLEEAWSRGFLPLFIAKTSTSKMLFKAPLPDIYYLRREEPVYPFMTTVRVYRGFRELKLGLEEAGRRGGPFFLPNLQEFYEDLAVYSFYARLSKGGPILKVEVAVPPGGPGPEEAAERAYRALASLPLKGGYPYPLVAAHSRARVTREDMERVLHALGLSLERRSRHMLP